MNKHEVIDFVAQKLNISKVAGSEALEAVLEAITSGVTKGEEVRFVGFGTFTVKSRGARKGRNPATGAEIDIAATKAVHFSSGAGLKAAVSPKVEAPKVDAPKEAPKKASKKK